MDANMFTMLNAFLVSILLFVGFMFMYRSLVGLSKESTRETNSILREILAELKKQAARSD
ncbi:MAG TPA: hypothetical protein EYM95_21960 [Candidatus Obscuribacterales bacterium]|jgi:hypothetical protein|nr:hypothetical protein [Candidatus Obscuribacterales bacterium]